MSLAAARAAISALPSTPRSGGNIAGPTISSRAIPPSGEPPPVFLQAAAARQTPAAPIRQREDCHWAMHAISPSGNSHAGLRLQGAPPIRFHLFRASRRAKPRRLFRPYPGGPHSRRIRNCSIPLSCLRKGWSRTHVSEARSTILSDNHARWHCGALTCHEPSPAHQCGPRFVISKHIMAQH